VRKDRKTILKEEKLRKRKKEERKEKKKRLVEVRKTDEEEVLREITVKIRLERINTYKRIIVKVLLDNKITDLVISSEFVKRKEFKLKKIKKPIYIRNVDRTFNKERPIEYIGKINIYYQGYRERTEIDMIRG